MSINQNFPEIRPSLNLNFARSKTLDPRITFTRASTATYVDEDGLIKTAAADEPRFDHDPETGESLGLLIEESRTNLFPYSGNTTITSSSNVTLSRSTGVDGNTTSALNAIYTSGSGAFILSANTAVSATNTYTFSIYMKRNSGTTNGVMYSYFNSGTAGQWSGTILNEDGQHLGQAPIGVWKRYSKTITVADGAGVQITLPGYDSNGLNVDYFGGQIEIGSFATSYIPTSGSTVTRQPDNASITGTNFSSWYNQSEGTVFVDYNKQWDGPWGYYRSIFMFNNSSNTDYIDYGGRTNGATNNRGVYFPISEGGTGQMSYTFYTVTNSIRNYKSAFALATNDAQLAQAGVLLGSDSSVTVPTVNQAVFDPTNLHISRLSYYPQRLTDSQLQNLTK